MSKTFSRVLTTMFLLAIAVTATSGAQAYRSSGYNDGPQSAAS
ncbi:MAG: hypothetical protein WKH64_06115 [Chloroflexia bacterium]